MDEQQETFTGLGSKVYVFRKEDFQEGVSFDELKEKAVAIDVSHSVSLAEAEGNEHQARSGWSQRIGFPFSFEIAGSRLEDCDESITNDDDPQHIKADVEFKTEDGKRYFVKDADIEINVCPSLPHKPKPLLWNKLPCDMLTPLCRPLRWGDKHFNRRILHYQWLKQNNYL